MAVLVTGPRRIAGVEFDVHSLLFSGVAVSVGVQFLAFAVLAKVAAIRLDVLPEDLRLVRALERLTLERGIVIGLGLALAGLIVLVGQVIGWGAGGFGELEVTSSIRWSILAGTTITIGVQFILVSFLIGVLRLNEVAD